MKAATVIDSLSAWWSEARDNTLFWRGLLLAMVIVIADQATKHWILHGIDLPSLRKIEISGIFDLTYVENRGASFGMLSGMRWPLVIISTGVALGLAWWLGRLRRPAAAIAVGFIIGGALGNLYDRLAYGFVVDFLDFSGLYFPWVFNIADAAINVGIAFLIYDAWRTGKQEKSSK